MINPLTEILRRLWLIYRRHNLWIRTFSGVPRHRSKSGLRRQQTRPLLDTRSRITVLRRFIGILSEAEPAPISMNP